MQAWQRQPAQCIFCAFRRSSVRTVSTSASSHQEYRLKTREHPDTNKGLERRRRDDSEGTNPFRVRRHDVHEERSRPGDGLMSKASGKPYMSTGRRGTPDTENGRRDRGPLVRDGKPLIRMGGPRDPNYSGKFVKPKLTTSVQIREGLSHLEFSMSNYKPDGQKKTQMQLLDPDGTKWPAFQRQIQSLAERALSEKGLGSHARREIWDRLSASYAENKESFEKELFFTFMDSSLGDNVKNISSLDDNPHLDLRFPTEWYTFARKTQRSIHLHVGPTNSGKTYNALKRLQEAKNGFYAGPLRLLAHEVYSRFRANGIACDLLTGDDIRYDENKDTQVYASTVEMVNCAREVDVAVIDEIQMLGHEERGWAWTRAFLGANAKEVHLCGEERVVPLIRELAASMGDTLQIHRYQRLNPLKCMSKSMRGNLKQLRKGDCIVAFSVMQIHALKRTIELETGRRCAIVYGSLPPETRAKQAELFNDPDNDYDYLVASDAIGMGLNLSIKRVIFNQVTRFDGSKQVLLSIPQIKQIAGRAGRYRSAHQDNQKTPVSSPDVETPAIEEETVGWVTTLDEADLPIVSKALSTEAPPLRRAGLMPPAEFLEEFNNKLPAGTPFEYLVRTVNRIAKTHPRFYLCSIKDTLAAARLIEDVPQLSIEQRVNICAAPVGGRNPSLYRCFKAFARAVSRGKQVSVVDIPEIPLEILQKEPAASREYLASLEDLHKCLILYLWLSYRFAGTLTGQPMAMHAKELTEEKITFVLRSFSANPALRQRLKKLQKQPESDGTLSAETMRYLEAMKQMEAEERAKDASIRRPEEAEVPQDTENQTTELIGDETFDEHFAQPTEFSSERVATEDDASTLEEESKEQVVETEPPERGAASGSG